MSKVTIVKVENGNVENAVRKAIELLGGLNKFVSETNEVLLKPNLLAAPRNKENLEKVRTDPRVLEALSKMLLELGKKVVIGDTCGQGIAGGTRGEIEKSGYLEIGKIDNRIEIRSLEQKGPIVTVINGKKLKTANVSRDVIEIGAIINVPKMKTHGLTIYTGAIKNLLGTICGSDKTRIHSVGGSTQGFSQCLVDLYAFEKPKIKLNVMDAIIAMEGLGPSTGGKAVPMDLILASDDAVALDAVAFKLMGHNPKKVYTTKYAWKQGLGEAEIDKIEILGEKIKAHQRKFKLPKMAFMGSIPYQKFTEVILRIPIYNSGCSNCENCVRACPKSVIKIIKLKDSKTKPKIDYKGCISCFTCLEVCPEACYSTKPKNLLKTITIGITALAIISLTVILLVLFL